jgi:DNA-directed RNA polymerase specialized sigma24 family protein
MGRDWTRKHIIELNNADEAAVEAWLDEYIHTIYTWLYYQVGADASITVDLTGRTFKRAIHTLATYRPESETMLQWLREQAKAARDEGLVERQMTAQRPWAWSHLPGEILGGLSHFRDEPLSEDVVNNPYVREIVQASLAEMESANRELMMHRYNHLDTPDHIAEEIGINTQDVNDRLYRCRHFFRRVFMQLIQTANAGFSESSASGSLELLDANLEKLLSATDMVQSVSPKDQARIREIVLEAARQTAPIPTTGPTKKTIFLAVTSVVALLVIAVLLVVIFSRNAAMETPIPVPAAQPEPTTPITVQDQTPANEDRLDEEEVRRVFQLGQEGDLAGLLAILRNGQYPSQLVALHYIRQIGDESAIGVLEEAEMKWHPNGPPDNPFAQAIIQIEDRLLAESGAVIEEPGITKPDEIAATEERAPLPISEPRQISGRVTDISDQPLAGAQITLLENLLYPPADNPKVLTRVVTSSQGRYTLPSPPVGGYFLDCRDPRDGLAVRRAVWCGQSQICQIDFEAKPAIYGLLNDAVQPLAGQMLYLSDTLDPADASFRAESVTAADRRFGFVGIPAGSYYLLSHAESGRIQRLAAIDVDRQDITNWVVTVQQAVLTVEINSTETAPMPVGVTLTYGPDVPEAMHEYVLEIQDDGTYISEAIPQGSYTLVADFDNGMRLQQPVELNADRILTITVPDGVAALSGTLTNRSPYLFFLYNTDQRVRFDLIANPAGMYAFDAMPPHTYTLATVVNNLHLDFLEIDLQNEPEQVLEIDAANLLAGLNPLYVVVTDERGAMLNDVQVWVTGTGEVVSTRTTGRGAFLALPQGEYSLYAALPGYATAEQPIVVEFMPLQTAPNPENTIHFSLKP